MSIALEVPLSLTLKEKENDEIKKFLQELIDWMVERWSLGAEEAARIAYQTVQQVRECLWLWLPSMPRAPRLATTSSAPA